MNCKIFKFSTRDFVQAGMLSSLCWLGSWWNVGLTLPFIAFLLAIVGASAVTTKIDRASRWGQIKENLHPKVLLLTLAFMTGLSVFPLCNTTLFLGKSLLLWPLVTLSGFVSGLAAYAIFRFIAWLVSMARQLGGGGNLATI